MIPITAVLTHQKASHSTGYQRYGTTCCVICCSLKRKFEALKHGTKLSKTSLRSILVHISIPAVAGTLPLPRAKFALLLRIATGFKCIMKKSLQTLWKLSSYNITFFMCQHTFRYQDYLNSSEKSRLFWLSNTDYLRLQGSKDKRQQLLQKKLVNENANFSKFHHTKNTTNYTSFP